MPTFRIVFTDPASPDEPAAIWSGYEDYSTAFFAAACGDLWLRMSWIYAIEKEPDEPEGFTEALAAEIATLCEAGFSKADICRRSGEIEARVRNRLAADPSHLHPRCRYHFGETLLPWTHPIEDEDEEPWCGFESYSAGLQYLRDEGDPL